MPSYNERIDAYILKSADFAKPILAHIRKVVHSACPQVNETMKWSFPHFEFAGGILCSMASFKNHCSFGFWLGSMMSDPNKIISQIGENSGVGHLDHLKSLEDLPPDKMMVAYIKEAMKLNEAGVKVPKKQTSPVVVEPPSYFIIELKKHKQAHAYFNKLSPSQQKEYIEWITEAKTEATKHKRINAAIELLMEGKTRHWKYVTAKI